MPSLAPSLLDAGPNQRRPDPLPLGGGRDCQHAHPGLAFVEELRPGRMRTGDVGHGPDNAAALNGDEHDRRRRPGRHIPQPALVPAGEVGTGETQVGGDGERGDLLVLLGPCFSDLHEGDGRWHYKHGTTAVAYRLARVFMTASW